MRFYFFFIIGRERERVESREFSTKKKTTTLTLTLVVVVVVVAFLKTASSGDERAGRKSGGKGKFLRGKNSFDRDFFSKSVS